jgi:seryl-tRNA synthetase
MHDLAYFREHLQEFEQMAANRGVTIDFNAFRALDQERRERITATERLKRSAIKPATKSRGAKRRKRTPPLCSRK